jgi:hypothetical protein
MSILTNAADAGSAGRHVFQNGGVGIAAVESENERPVFAVGVVIEGRPQVGDLLNGAPAEAGIADLAAILRQGLDRSAGLGLGRRGGMDEGNGREAEVAVVGGHGGRDLQKALRAHEVGLEARPEGIASPSDTGGVQAGAPQQGIVEDGAKRRTRGELGGDVAADHGKDV